MPLTEQEIAKLEQRLTAAHGQADSLLAKLQAIKAIADQLPAIQFLDELETRLSSVLQKCAAVQAPKMDWEPTPAGIGPTPADLTLLADRLGEIVAGLQQFASAAEQLAADVEGETDEANE